MRSLGCLSALLLVLCACRSDGPEELAAKRRAEVRVALARHLNHEEQMLQILEANRATPEAAAAELGRYAEQHTDELKALCDQRRLLETEPDALAAALSELAERSRSAFARRSALYTTAPELMEHPSVKRSLSLLDTL